MLGTQFAIPLPGARDKQPAPAAMTRYYPGR